MNRLPLIFVDGHENKVCVVVVGFLRYILHGVIKVVRHSKWLVCWIGLSGLDPLAILIHVTHLGFCGDRDVKACPLQCESQPSLEISSVDSLCESGLDRVVETRIVIIHQLACVGTFVEAVCQGCVGLRRHERHTVGKMSDGSGKEGDDGSGDITDS